jgi:hypothetical protein
MSEVPDPTGGWAKATQETAKASQDVTQAVRELGHFFRGPLGELVVLTQIQGFDGSEEALRMWCSLNS